MLKGIPELISPNLIRVLMEMGHGDEIVIADGNFPAARCAKRLVRCDGIDTPRVLEAVLELLPLDVESKWCVSLMDTGDKNNTPGIWDKYKRIILNYEPEFGDFEIIERFDFYDRAEGAYAIIATGEKELFANIILKKGVI